MQQKVMDTIVLMFSPITLLSSPLCPYVYFKFQPMWTGLLSPKVTSRQRFMPTHFPQATLSSKTPFSCHLHLSIVLSFVKTPLVITSSLKSVWQHLLNGQNSLLLKTQKSLLLLSRHLASGIVYVSIWICFSVCVSWFIQTRECINICHMSKLKPEKQARVAGWL